MGDDQHLLVQNYSIPEKDQLKGSIEKSFYEHTCEQSLPEKANSEFEQNHIVPDVTVTFSAVASEDECK